MGVAYKIATDKVERADERSVLKRAYYTQLGLNYAWSILYFNLKIRKFALIESFALLAAGNVAATKFYQVYKVSGAFMFYVSWLSYASYLNKGTFY